MLEKYTGRAHEDSSLRLQDHGDVGDPRMHGRRRRLNRRDEASSRAQHSHLGRPARQVSRRKTRLARVVHQGHPRRIAVVR